MRVSFSFILGRYFFMFWGFWWGYWLPLFKFHRYTKGRDWVSNKNKWTLQIGPLTIQKMRRNEKGDKNRELGKALVNHNKYGRAVFNGQIVITGWHALWELWSSFLQKPLSSTVASVVVMGEAGNLGQRLRAVREGVDRELGEGDGVRNLANWNY